MALATGSIKQPVKDGQIVGNEKDPTLADKTKKTGNNSLDKDAFLQLLVAQMKYQDPLEPTSNTEYISQLATFSSLEEMQNLNATVTDAQAAGLIGKQVIMKQVSTATGETTYASGKVDMVVREGGKTYLIIEDKYYNIDELDSIIDEDYLDAATLADTFEKMILAMPYRSQLTASDKDNLEKCRKAYDSMTDYQKGFVRKEFVDKLKELEDRMKELLAGTEGGEDEGEGDTGDTGGTGGTEGGGGSGSGGK